MKGGSNVHHNLPSPARRCGRGFARDGRREQRRRFAADRASGTLTYTSSTFNSSRAAGGNLIFDLSATVSYTGTLSGTSTLHGTLIFHPDGTANFSDIETFTGTVNGVPGTVTFNLNGHADPSR
jgi:hypothetical protein